MTNSAEFYNNFVLNQSDVQFLTFIYDQILARPYDMSGLSTWSAVRMQPYGWQKVVKSILSSTEYRGKFGSTTVKKKQKQKRKKKQKQK